MIEEVHKYMQASVDLIFTQIQAKKGIEEFGERGVVE